MFVSVPVVLSSRGGRQRVAGYGAATAGFTVRPNLSCRLGKKSKKTFQDLSLLPCFVE